MISDFRLSDTDLYFAGLAGVMRRISAMRKKRPEPYGKPSTDLWGTDIESCAAEMLVSMAIDRAWIPYRSTPGQIKSDVGTIFQVRSTDREDGCLLLHERDRDHHVFVLVVGSGCNKRIAGCILGSKGKQERFWNKKAPRPCYYVPQHELEQMETVMASIEGVA